MTLTFEDLNGRLAAAAAAQLPRGAYTTLRTYGGRRVLRLVQHVQRLRDSSGVTLEERRVRRALASALREAGHAESRVRLTWAPPRLFVSVDAFEPLPEAFYREGVACATVSVRRDNPHAKDTAFLSTADRARAALPAGVHEGLMTAEDGAILEGLSSNVFALARGRLHTEDARALPGVTRSIALELARRRVPVELTPVRVQDLARLEECFLTSVSRGVLPVVRIDGRRIGAGAPGPVTMELRAALDAFADAEAEPLEG